MLDTESIAMQAIRGLCVYVAPWRKESIQSLFETGQYQVHNEPAPEEYDVQYSEICFGWLVSSDKTSPVVATFASGERGNERYDPDHDGLHIWYQEKEASNNAKILQAAKALLSKTIGFEEFKRVVKELL